MDAAFMSFQPHESGIHAVRSGAGEASVTRVRFWCAPRPPAAAVIQARPEAVFSGRTGEESA
jgi:hypothetical protein